MRNSLPQLLNLYKLMILYLLNKVNFPLTNSQISNFLINSEYTNYFNVQQSLSELVDSKLISSEAIYNNTQYTITQDGIQMIDLFQDRLLPSIKEDVVNFLKKNKYEINQELSNTAVFYPATNGEYTAICSIKERNTTLLEIHLNVTSIEQAETVCENWKTNNADVYSYVVNKLMYKK